MTTRKIKYLGCVAAVAVSGLGAAPPTAAAARHVVLPGQSIQQAVDAAQPGDTIVIAPGTYRESVLITKSRLTLRGAGSRTVIMPPASGAGAGNRCATAGNGMCVLGTDAQPVQGTTIRSLRLSGFKKNALWASRTDRLTVQGVIAEKNGQWGIAEERSTRSLFWGNTARDNAESGLFLSNTIDTEAGATDTQGTVVRYNLLQRNRIGVTVRRLRNLTVANNSVTGNCNGVFVVGDEGRPQAGDMAIRRNTIYSNNKYCAQTARLPYIQGSGIVLTGAEDTLVEGNVIRGNEGKSTFSGGIVLYKSFVGAVNQRNVIRDNMVLGNTTADLANRDTTGSGNRFSGNLCKVSEPAGMC
ncbi:right-handed parallel beta-helix repeat-containing protein [Streptomyces jeddahensis]|nr:right-handed parallel beta-helix repeat-containing protein [Streptomyces jeddahensis]